MLTLRALTGTHPPPNFPHRKKILGLYELTQKKIPLQSYSWWVHKQQLNHCGDPWGFITCPMFDIQIFCSFLVLSQTHLLCWLLSAWAVFLIFCGGLDIYKMHPRLVFGRISNHSCSHQQAQTNFSVFWRWKVHLILLILLWSSKPDIYLLHQYFFTPLEWMDWPPGKQGTASLCPSQKTWEIPIAAFLFLTVSTPPAELLHVSMALPWCDCVSHLFSPLPESSFNWVLLIFSHPIYIFGQTTFFPSLVLSSAGVSAFIPHSLLFFTFFRQSVQGLIPYQLHSVIRTTVDQQLIQL